MPDTLNTVELDRCRKCCDEFRYSHDIWSTRVIVGLPKTKGDYKAVSYVWGDTKPLPLKCRHCQHVTTVPMESEEKFRRLMTVTKLPGHKIWLDALSIDQSDHQDIAAQMAKMGDIYSNASAVAVLLPKSDLEAYRAIEEIGDLTNIINTKCRAFSKENADAETEMLGRVAQRFWQLIGEFSQSRPKFAYWRRAWTFQEWALSRDISLSCEASEDEINLEGIKYPILKAATTMVIYKLQWHHYAVIDVGITRGTGPVLHQTLRRLFPDQHAFLPPDAVSEAEANTDAMFPSRRFRSMLGLRQAVEDGSLPCYACFNLHADLPRSAEQRFLERFSMAMNALGTSKREARFEADLVASWASMCNVQYDYDKADTVAQALKKVIGALRKDHGLRLYNFQVNTVGSSGELGLCFFEYAVTHRSGLTGAYLHGLPILTGRADTATHLKLCLSNPRVKTAMGGSGTKLRRVDAEALTRIGDFDDADTVVDTIYATSKSLSRPLVTSGKHMKVRKILANLPPEAADKFLVLATIKTLGEDGGTGKQLQAWAVCGAGVDLAECFVAHEEVNGTPVVARKTAGNDDSCVVEAYLTITDKADIAHLVKMDGQGTIDMTVPGIAGFLRDGAIYKGCIGDETLVAY